MRSEAPFAGTAAGMFLFLMKPCNDDRGISAEDDEMKFEELPESIQAAHEEHKKNNEIVRVRATEGQRETTFTVTTKVRIYTWKWDNSSPDRSQQCWKSTMRPRLPLYW